MAEFYEKHNNDLLKETIGLSGALSITILRSNKGGVIFLFSFRYIDKFQNVRSNVVGVPSFVFSRYEKANETLIDYANVQSIVGLDANDL